MPSDDLDSRLRSLTAREVQVLGLVGSMRHGEIAERLGLTSAQLRNAVASIRRKLAAPTHLPIARVARELVGEDRLRALEVRPASSTSGRPRQRHVLRATIDELAALAERARERAELIDLTEAEPPADVSQRVADLLAQALDRVQREVRA